MAESTPKRRSPCKWIARDDEGRPRCEHGWAVRTGSQWRCPDKRRAAIRRYSQTENAKHRKLAWNKSAPSREAKRRYGLGVYGRLSKALYDLTRVR